MSRTKTGPWIIAYHNTKLHKWRENKSNKNTHLLSCFLCINEINIFNRQAGSLICNVLCIGKKIYKYQHQFVSSIHFIMYSCHQHWGLPPYALQFESTFIMNRSIAKTEMYLFQIHQFCFIDFCNGHMVFGSNCKPSLQTKKRINNLWY